MFFQLSTAAAVDEAQHQQQFSSSISPLFGSGNSLQNAAMQLTTSMISPYYQPLGHLSPALFMPSLLNSSMQGSFMNSLANATGSGPAQHRKLFIGGLSHETSDDQLREYYSQWGQVVDCIVIRDPVTRQSRGFGFVTFATTEMADAAMIDRPHTIAGKIVDPKRAIPREQMLQAVNCPPAFLDIEPPTECKLLLTGIDGFHTVDILRHYFERFGELEQVEIVGHTGFGFIVYEERMSVKKCLGQGKLHLINGRKVEVREADQQLSRDGHDDGKSSGSNSSRSPPMAFRFPPSHGSRAQRKRGGGGTREKSNNSTGSQGSQAQSPTDSTQSETEHSN